MVELITEHALYQYLIMPQKSFLLVGFDHLKHQIHFRRKRYPQFLITELCDSMPQYGLQIDPEIVVVSIVHLAFHFRGLFVAEHFQGLDGHVDDVFFVGKTVHNKLCQNGGVGWQGAIQTWRQYAVLMLVSYNQITNPMKLSLASRKDSKNCLYFIKALQHLGKHCPKDQEKKMYMHFSNDELKMTNTLSDIHHHAVQQFCMLTIRRELFNIDFTDHNVRSLVYEVDGFKLIKSFSKNEHKIVLVELSSTQNGLKLYYETEGGEIQWSIRVKAKLVHEAWPQHPQSQSQAFYEISKLCDISPELKKLSQLKQQENMWITLKQDGLRGCIMDSERPTMDLSCHLQVEEGYSFNDLRARLHGKIHIGFDPEWLLIHLEFCFKKMKSTSVYIKIISDNASERQFIKTYLIMKTPLESGWKHLIIPCDLSQDCNPRVMVAQEEPMRPRVEGMAPEFGGLLKKEDNPHFKGLKINFMDDKDQEEGVAEGGWLQTRHFGKVEEAEETMTRKYDKLKRE